ncbi:class I SAM-dependent methyltransferase [Baaleninema sp.]|uniref:class I SAM-dependent methyltransferase n=1 Tax=Baaleninema sp. TaxID=3101197 RepID=UPI003D0280EA
MNDLEQEQLFFEIHSNNPRESPGSFESTQKAFSMLDELSSSPNILDVGCGPGMQTLDLARLTEGTITAIDTHQPYIDRLSNQVQKLDLQNRILTRNLDMSNLPFSEGEFDLIWSEGAIYNIGFEAGLNYWKSFLKPKGYVAVTEISWLRSPVSDEAAQFWNTNYPQMQDIATNLNSIARAGYREIGHFVLPESDWLDNYYSAIEPKLSMLREQYGNDADAMAIIESEQQEIDLYRRHSDEYGYVFYIAQKS